MVLQNSPFGLTKRNFGIDLCKKAQEKWKQKDQLKLNSLMFLVFMLTVNLILRLSSTIFQIHPNLKYFKLKPSRRCLSLTILQFRNIVSRCSSYLSIGSSLTYLSISTLCSNRVKLVTLLQSWTCLFKLSLGFIHAIF